MLQKEGVYNDLSPKLRAELEAKIQSFGKRVRYKFDVRKPNPDPLKYNGEWIFPDRYTLDPKVFTIVDTDEPTSQKAKKIGIVDKVNADNKPESFKCIRVLGKQRGVLEFDLEDPEQQAFVMMLELHPKLKGGKFADKNRIPVVERIDETALATEQKQIRSLKLKAQLAAQQMSDAEVVEFANAMTWDATEEPLVLRNKIEELAENAPELFTDTIESKDLQYQSLVNRALTENILSFDPVSNVIAWAANQQAIATLSSRLDKNHVEKMAEWLQTAAKGGEVFNKIKKLLKK